MIFTSVHLFILSFNFSLFVHLFGNKAWGKHVLSNMSVVMLTQMRFVFFFSACQLLKSEVRRLERNQEREKSVANLEYLKNVLLQFIFLHSGSERQALLPVIHTMLQLSPEEKSKLAAIAQGTQQINTVCEI